MARKCSVCEHDDLAEINSELASGEPLRTIADRWSVSKTELMRHRNYHLSVSAIMAKEVEEIAQANDFLDQITRSSGTHSVYPRQGRRGRGA